MAYAAQTDMEARFGEQDVIMLTDRDDTGEINGTVLQQALDDAGAVIDSYLAARYDLPFTEVPRVLVSACCDIARYNLCGVAGRLMPEDVKTRYDGAINILKSVARGEMTLGVLQNGVTVASGNPITFKQGPQVGLGQELRRAF